MMGAPRVATRLKHVLDKTIGEFVSSLRKADLQVSPAETLDAVAAVDFIGVRDRVLLKNSLSIILAKTVEEKALFDICFERFFSFEHFHARMPPPVWPDPAGPDSDSAELPQDGMASVDAEAPRRRRRRAPLLAHHTSRLGHLLLEGDQAALSLAMAQAGREVHLDQIKTLRERGVFAKRILLHMGVKALEREILRLRQDESERTQQTATFLHDAKLYLTNQVRDFVEQQYLLLVDGTGTRFIRDAVTSTKLTNMQRYYFDHIRDAVRKIAHRLAKKHAKRRKVFNRGQLDVRKTLRSNLAYDGKLFDVRWKQIKLERPKVFAICDVSGSVKNVSRFLLTFLYSLNEVLPKVRSFAFSNELGEVSDLFARYPVDKAIDMALDDYGKGSTDYGRAFRDFKEICFSELDSKSTVIILGDARNNYYEPETDVIRDIFNRTKQVIWLNPEPRDRWDVGDAEMKSFLPYCTYADVCNSLQDLERMVSKVLKSAR